MKDIEKNRVNNNNNNYYQNEQPQQQQQQYAPAQHNYYVPKSDKLWTSWLVPLFVAANVAIFIIVMFVNNCPKNNFTVDGCVAKFLGPVSFQPFRENPFLGPSSNTLLKMGGLQWDKVVNQHQGWRLFSAMWLHAGVIHLVDNMMSLVLIGVRLEQEFGFLRIGLLYVVSGLGGSILSSLFLQKSVSVGASGALFGLVGAMLAELLTNWTTNDNKGAALFTLLFMSAVNLAIGLLPFVDNFAHIGGFATGFLLGFILLVRPRYGWKERHQLAEHARVKTKYLPYQQVLFVIALVALIAGFIVAATMLFQGKRGNDQCKWCHYVDCIPSSRWNCGN